MHLVCACTNLNSNPGVYAYNQQSNLALHVEIENQTLVYEHANQKVTLIVYAQTDKQTSLYTYKPEVEPWFTH